MSDSEEKISQPGEEKTPGTTEEIIKHYVSGEPVRIVRGKGGKFAKQKTTAASSSQARDVLRNLLEQAEAGPDGRMRRGDKSRYRKILDNQIKNAMMDAERPILDKMGNPIIIDGKPLTAVDPKVMMASTQAFKELTLRAYGAPSKSDEEIEAMKTQGVKVVVIAPPEMLNKEVVEEKPKEKLVPSFIDAVEITTNPR
jgi:hypothetical protein